MNEKLPGRRVRRPPPRRGRAPSTRQIVAQVRQRVWRAARARLEALVLLPQPPLFLPTVVKFDEREPRGREERRGQVEMPEDQLLVDVFKMLIPVRTKT